MDYTTLGRTGLRVSVAGLGCGGFSRLGMSTGKTEAESVALVRLAIDSGINLIDTAANYRTEEIVGKAIAGVPRDKVVIGTKCSTELHGEQLSPAQIIESLEASLRRLGTDHVDVFHLHGVTPEQYHQGLRGDRAGVAARARTRQIPLPRHHRIAAPATTSTRSAPRRRRRHLGRGDGGVQHAAPDRQRRLFPLTTEAASAPWSCTRCAASSRVPALLRRDPRTRRHRHGARRLAASDAPLDFLVHPGGAESITDAAYRFARYSAGSTWSCSAPAAQTTCGPTSTPSAPPLPEGDSGSSSTHSRV